MARGGAAPAVLNGANEMAVSAFLDGSIHFLDIATTVAKTLDKAEQLGLFTACMDIEDALQVDAEARELARDVMTKLS
jgi:1-deoxy-D-xylulose-5-phosphate reductoisomerase